MFPYGPVWSQKYSESQYCFANIAATKAWIFMKIFKLRLGALIPRSVGLSVCLSVCLSSKNYKKNYKTLQNVTKQYKTLQNVTKHWNKEFLSPPFQLWRLSRKLRQYAGAALTESSFSVMCLTFNHLSLWQVFKCVFCCI